MKILAIRGRNLASLDGDFAVNLADEPLASAGVFAITGPTGAGKSTLLDTMCLALFGRTPRLVKQARADYTVGSEADALSPTDPRAILRRGATSGYAEVDFSGTDRSHYRARWEVRRARAKIQGTLQAAEQSLERLGETPWKVSDKASEVLIEIERKLGLDFEHFRRSVLIAQGDFAAFLRAPGKERAGLLERVTGSELYARLSKAAFERSKLVQARLAEVRRDSEAIAVRSAAEREAMHQIIATAKRQREDAEEQLKPLRAALAWHEHEQVLLADQARAQAMVSELAQHNERLSLLRVEVAHLQVAQEVAPWVTRWQELQTSAREGSERVEAHEKAWRHAQAELVPALAQKKLSAAALLDRRAQIEREKPTLQRARDLEALMQSKLEEQALAVADHEQAKRAVATFQPQMAAQALERANAQTQRNDVAGREERTRALFKIQGQASWLHDEIQALAVLRTQLKTVQHEQNVAALDFKQVLEKPTSGREQLAALQRELMQIRQARAELGVVEEWPQIQARHRDLDALRERVRTLQHALRVFARWLEVHEQARIKALQVQDLAHEEATLQATLTTLAPQQHEAMRAQESAQNMLSALEQARSLAGHRSQLVDGKPCPLCGATEHPWFDPVLIDRGCDDATRLFVAARDTAQRLTQQVQAATLNEAGIRARREEATLACSEVNREVAQLRGEVDAAAELCAVAGQAFAQPLSLHLAWKQVEDLAVAHEHERQLRELGILQRKDLDVQERGFAQRAQWTQREDELNRAIQAQESVLAQAEAAVREAVQRHEKATMAFQMVDERVREKRQTLHVHLVGIEDFAARLGDEDVSVAHALAASLNAREQVVRDLALAEQRVQAAQERESAGQREGVRLHEALERTGVRVASLLQAMRVLESEHHGLLGSRRVAQVEVEQGLAIQSAQDADDAAQQRLQAAELACTAASTAKASWIERHSEVQRELAMQDERLTLELTRRAVSHDEVIAGCARLASLPILVEQIRGLEDARLQAQAKLQASGAQLALHHDKRPSGDVDTTRAQVEAISRARDQAVASEATEQTRLKADDEAQVRRAQCSATLIHEEQSGAPWLVLGKAIGHHNGDTFRNFAQNLAFEGLLAHANLHLRELDRRYQLQRVPATALEVQIIDHDLGDEVRSIHSLSGGETFLISLALALGLSSMSSQREPVESLFIDEGFGTLDRETLDRALSALEALRAGGRQVGIISHVEGLAEHLGVHIDVRPRGGARSSVHVVARS